MKAKLILSTTLLFACASSYALSLPGEGQGQAGADGQNDQQQSADQAKGTGGQRVATEAKSNQIITEYRVGIQDSSAVSKAPPSKMIKPVIAQ